MTPAFSEMFRAFGRIGLLSFGGPAAQIAVMHRVLVDETRWLTEEQFLRALSFCMMLPGPEAMQLATYAGWRLRGVTGGVLAGLLFVVPGAIVIAALAAVYLSFGTVPLVQALFLGIKAAVVMIVLQALWRLSKKALNDSFAVFLAVTAFAALFAFQIPFPIVIGLAALAGALQARAAPADIMQAPVHPGHWRVIALWVVLWAAPLPLLWFAEATFLLDLSLFFGKLALVTFGGAYAVLAYMTQEVVQVQGWITAPQMIDALGLAETTPGPLILVTQFVGHLAGAQVNGVWGFVTAGLLTLWMTFVPCFLWIFAGAPYLERLTGHRRIGAALKAITAAVVGVIANLSLWFALNVMFGALYEVEIGPAFVVLPSLSSFDMGAAGLSLIAAAMLFGLRTSIPMVLGVVALCALILHFLI